MSPIFKQGARICLLLGILGILGILVSHASCSFSSQSGREESSNPDSSQEEPSDSDTGLSPETSPTSLPPPVAGLITVTFLEDGMAQISATSGAVVGGATVVILNKTNGESTTVIAEADGSFVAILKASPGDVIEIYQMVGEASSSSTTITVVEALEATQIDSGLHGGFTDDEGGKHTCALMNDTTVRCWGKGDKGQLGSTETGSADSATPVVVSDPEDPSQSLTGVTQISVGAKTSCALLANTEVACWGYGAHGILGDGDTSEHTTLTPVRVKKSTNSYLSGVVQVSVGAWHACALMEDSTIKCWGDAINGKLGNGSTSGDVTEPTPVILSSEGQNLTGVQQISASAHHTCTLMNNGTVMCWGDGHYGKVGNDCIDEGDTCDELYPYTVSGVSDAVEVYTADNHTCALLSDGRTQCWGTNREGQLGNNTISSDEKKCDTTPCDSGSPVYVLDPDNSGSPLSSIDSLAVSTYHVCASLQSGEAACWGNGHFGGLGDGDTTNHEVYLPLLVTHDDGSAFSDATQVTTGLYHSCALRQTGQIECWGDKYLLGTGDFLGMTDTEQQGLGTPVDVVF